MAALLAALGLATTDAAFADERLCTPAPVEADAHIRAQWPDLPAAIRAALDGREDLDACARVAVRLDHATIRLGVHLLDGRSASRAVSRKEDVVPTLMALLLLPEGPAAPGSGPRGIGIPAPAVGSAPEAVLGTAPAVDRTARAGTAGRPATVMLEATTSGPPAGGPPKGSATVTAVSLAASGPAPATPPHARFRFELSVATGARAGDGYRGLALGVLTSLDIDGWLLGLQGAAAQYQRTGEGLSSSSLLLALMVGRRFRFDDPSSPSIDLTAGPALAMRGIGAHYAVRMPAGSGETPPEPDDGPWARLVVGARVNFRRQSLLRPFAGIDGEFALASWAPAPVGGEPRLPAWTLGLMVGAAVGAP
jgi:hypothetical protein